MCGWGGSCCKRLNCKALPPSWQRLGVSAVSWWLPSPRDPDCVILRAPLSGLHGRRSRSGVLSSYPPWRSRKHTSTHWSAIRSARWRRLEAHYESSHNGARSSPSIRGSCRLETILGSRLWSPGDGSRGGLQSRRASATVALGHSRELDGTWGKTLAEPAVRRV